MEKFDTRSDKGSSLWGYARSELIKDFNRHWYGFDHHENQVPISNHLIYVPQDNPTTIEHMSGTAHMVNMLKSWYGKVDLLNGSEYNAYQRYGLSFMDLLYGPPQLMDALDTVRSDEFNANKDK